MSTYKGRVALITGASCGIGAAIAEDLVKEGLLVVGAARQVERIQTLSESLKGQPGRLIAKKLDVSKPKEMEEIFKTIEQELGGVDILINNAGVLHNTPVYELTAEEIAYTTDVNYTSVILATREAVKGMIHRKIDDGYIINLNSIVGHQIPHKQGISLGIYPSAKFAMTATSQLLRHDFKNAGLKFRVTNLCPGAVDTEMIAHYKRAKLIPNYLSPHDIAKTVNFVLSLPKSVEITEMTIRPTNEVY